MKRQRASEVSFGSMAWFYFTGAVALSLALSLNAPAQESADTGAADKDPHQSRVEQARTEILEIFRAGGEQGLRTWSGKNPERLDPALIDGLAADGVGRRSEDFLRVALILAQARGEDRLTAEVRRQYGDYAFFTGQIDLALEEFRLALPIFEHLGDARGQGAIFLGMGRVHATLGNNDQALAMYDKALPLFEQAGDEVGQGNVWRKKGDVYSFTGDDQRALAMYDRALPFIEKAGDARGLGYLCLSKESIFVRAGDYGQAQALCDQALRALEQAAVPMDLGHVWHRKGNIFALISDYTRALAMYDRALAFFEQAQDPTGQASVWLSKGDIYVLMGDHEQALGMYDRALPFVEKTGSPLGQGSAWFRKGKIHFYAGDYAQALLMYGRALPFFEQASDPLGQGEVWQSRGDICWRIGDNGQALAMYQKALPFMDQVADRMALGNLWFGMADISWRAGDIPHAHAMLDKALRFFEQAESPLGQGNVWHRRGDIYRDVGDYAKAMAMYDRALPLYEQARDPRSLGNVWEGKADICRKQGESSQALVIYDKAMGFFERASDPLSIAYVRLDKAQVLDALGQVQNAALLYEQGLAGMELARTQSRLPDLKKSFTNMVYGNYESAALFFLRNGMGEKAFRVAESMRARTFLDRLAEGRVDLSKGIPAGLRARRDLLMGRLAVVSQSLAEAVGKGEEDLLARRKGEKMRVEAELAELENLIRLENPLYAAVKYPKPVTVAELREKVLRPGEVLAEYLLSDGGCQVFLVTRDRFEVLPLSRPRKEIEADVTAYLAAVTDRTGSAASGRRLYADLVAPVEKMIKPGQTLIVAPDGFLARLPFEALPAGGKKGEVKFLLEVLNVRYVQSATVLAFQRTQREKSGASDGFVGFGDPVYDPGVDEKQEQERGNSVGRNEDAAGQLARGKWDRTALVLERLPGTGVEVQSLDALFAAAGRPHVSKLRQEAREESAKSPELSKAGYIHFACHGLLDDDFQCLALSYVPDSAEDGFLELSEIMNLDWNARLVVLSACDTGRGKLERGEGITGLTRAVMYAGTPAVVASLWSVSDEGTAELMTRFYGYLVKDQLPLADALRQAKLDLLKGKTVSPRAGALARERPGGAPGGSRGKDAAGRPGSSGGLAGGFSAPYHWGAFVLYGE